MSKSKAKVSANQAAYTNIRKRILLGTIEQGAILSEAQIQGLTKHTRTPVRTAIVNLEADGLVEVADKKGTLIPQVTVQELRALLGLRLAVETVTACALSLKLQVMKGLARPLRELVATMQKLAQSDTLNDDQIMKLIDLDIQFHALIAELADYHPAVSALRRWQHRIMIAIPRSREPGQVKSVVAEHSRLIDAMEKGPEASVGIAVKEHLVGGARRYFPGLEIFVDQEFPALLRAGVRGNR